MKNLPVILFSLALLSFTGKDEMKITPPGTVPVNDSFYFDETEVSNFYWQEYMDWQKRTYGDTSSHYLRTIPDTNVWTDHNVPFRRYYLTHPAYKDYPVVGVSFEQAWNFCNWRTAVVKIYYDKLKERKPKTVIPKDLKYRLPTTVEWEQMAVAGFSEKTLKEVEKKHEGQMMYNLINSKLLNNPPEHPDTLSADITAPIKSYRPDKNGIYNLIGNVAEITDQRGFAKGGSWKHRDDEVTVKRNFVYNEPANWLGFRCVCEVKR